MKTFVKFGMVLAGYVAAVLVANAAVAVRIANTSGPDAQASAGMYAFGDGLLFIAVFGCRGALPDRLGALVSATVPLVLDCALDNRPGDCRHGDPGRIGLRNEALSELSASPPLEIWAALAV